VSPGVPVLTYHSVSDDPPASTRALSVRPSRLAAQLRFLRDHGFVGLTFGDLCRRVRAGVPLPERPVVLTFDDGYADTHETALPLLVEHGFPATTFVTTGWLRDAGPDAAGRPLDRTMCWSQVRELADAGIEVAAHSHSHAQLDQLGDRDLTAELARSKVLLEDRLGTEVPSLAYPFGYSSPRVRDLVVMTGYRQAAAVDNATAAPQAVAGRRGYSVPRLTVRRTTSPEVFARIVSADRADTAYRLDHALTRGWWVVRRSQSLLRGVRLG
jgi:peptidoglycan/xylan/chitin deacetylase (PgdA/CDA1 family)